MNSNIKAALSFRLISPPVVLLLIVTNCVKCKSLSKFENWQSSTHLQAIPPMREKGKNNK